MKKFARKKFQSGIDYNPLGVDKEALKAYASNYLSEFFMDSWLKELITKYEQVGSEINITFDTKLIPDDILKELDEAMEHE